MIDRDLPPSLTGRYDVIARLDDGRGSKQLFLAADRRGGSDAVIARFPLADPDKLAYEIARLQRLDSAYLPRIFDLCIESRDPYHEAYLVVEHCDGPTLAQVVSRGALEVADAAPILLELARAVAAIHGVGVVWPELRLTNVMLASSAAGPRLVLLDLGLAARLSVVDVDLAEPSRDLTPRLPYLSRELILGWTRDPRSDAYALGVCGFRILTGELPIPVRGDESPFEYMMRARSAVIDLAQLPAELPAAARAILVRMLDPDRDRRPVMPEVVAAFAQAFGAPSLIRHYPGSRARRADPQ